MMDYKFFESRPQIKNTLISDGCIFSGAELIGGVSFNESVNVGDDLNFGSCIVSDIQFQLSNQNDAIDQIAGKEFVWKQAVHIGEKSFQGIVKSTRSKLICINGNIAYVALEREPYLSIWDVNNRVKLQDVAEQPSLPVQAFAFMNNKLYCLHEGEPYLTTYAATGQTLSLTASPKLNDFEIKKIQYLCGISYSCNVNGNALLEYNVDLYNLKASDLIETTYEYVQMGIFIAEKPTKINETLIKVNCLDRLSKFDRYVDEWANSLTYPITLKDYLKKLCAHIGVALATDSFLNQGYIIQKNYRGQNVTGLQILRWIAQIAVRFGRMNEKGQLLLDWYKQIDYTLDNTGFESVEVSDFTTKKIEKLQIKATENDIGVIVPKDDPLMTNLYVIENNPLLYAETDTELRPTAETIFNAVKNITYQPYSVKISECPLLRAGAIYTLITRKGYQFPAYVMSRNMNGKMDTLSAVGNQERETQTDAVNQQIQQLRGSVHEMVIDISTLSSTITNYKELTDKEIDKLGVDIGDAKKVISVQQSSINQLATEISTKVSKTLYDENNNTISKQFSEFKQLTDRFSLSLYGDTNKKGLEARTASLELSLDGFFLNINRSGLKFTQNGLETIDYGTDKNGIEHEYKTTIGKGKLAFTVDGSEIYFIKAIHNGATDFNGTVIDLKTINLQFTAMDYISLSGTKRGLHFYEVNASEGKIMALGYLGSY